MKSYSQYPNTNSEKVASTPNHHHYLTGASLSCSCFPPLPAGMYCILFRPPTNVSASFGKAFCSGALIHCHMPYVMYSLVLVFLDRTQNTEPYEEPLKNSNKKKQTIFIVYWHFINWQHCAFSSSSLCFNSTVINLLSNEELFSSSFPNNKTLVILQSTTSPAVRKIKRNPPECQIFFTWSQ